MHSALSSLPSFSVVAWMWFALLPISWAGLVAANRKAGRCFGLVLNALALGMWTASLVWLWPQPTRACMGLPTPIAAIWDVPYVANQCGRQRRTRRALQEEPRQLMNMIFKGLARQYSATGSLPTFAAAPANLPCDGKPGTWSAREIHAWGAIGFEPDDPTYYAYEVTRPRPGDPEGTILTILASADLDCDSLATRWEFFIAVDAEGELFHPKGFVVHDGPE
jgi:hypothetical protein